MERHECHNECRFEMIQETFETFRADAKDHRESLAKDFDDFRKSLQGVIAEGCPRGKENKRQIVAIWALVGAVGLSVLGFALTKI